MKRDFLLFLTVLLLIFAGVVLGARVLGLGEIFSSPIAELRLIRILAALIIGGSLALAGMTFQAVLKNVLAEPFTLGISGGAGVGAALAVVLGLKSLTLYAVPFSALAGALAVLLLVLIISRNGSYGTESLLLSGIIAGTVCSSILMYLLSVAETEELANVTWWMLGDLQSVDLDLLIFQGIYALIATVILFILGNDINAISLGDEQAFYMGVNVKRVNFILILTASLLAAGTVALAGIISFCGLIIPHIVRKLWGSDHKKIIFTNFFAGGIFLMLCDIGSRSVFTARELPIGVLTAVIGGPVFLFLLNRRSKNGDNC
ncbi:MAG: iron ABC transporter permease [Lentisphaeria bacterium]|nr:iron ABC transporter permease [Lentisphaeria bacterium]